jgi:hypothetical protein
MRLAHVPNATIGSKSADALAGVVLNPIDREPESAMNPADGILPTGDVPANVSAIRLAGLIRDDASRILANWSMRITTLPAFRAVPELALDELQEDMPDLLESIVEAVSLSPYEFDPMPMEIVARKAATHGVARANSFPVDVVLTEIQILQREVRNAIWRYVADVPVTIIHEFDERLNEVFELAERSVVASWVRQHEEMPTPLRRGDAA